MGRTTRQSKGTLRKATPSFSTKRDSIPARHSPPRKLRPATSFERECLELIFGILAGGGLTVPRLRAVSDEVLADLVGSGRQWNAADLDYFSHLAHILSLWHMLAGYVDARAAPTPLPLFGKGPSLAKLIARVFPEATPEEVLETLVRVGAVRRNGSLWMPCGRSLIFRSPKVARLRILSDLVHFLRTAQYNLTHSRNKLLQQSAFNPAVPERDFRRVHARIQERVQQFLIEQDADLSRLEEASSVPEPVIGTGIGIYMYRDLPGPTAPSSVSRSRKQRRGPR